MVIDFENLKPCNMVEATVEVKMLCLRDRKGVALEHGEASVAQKVRNQAAEAVRNVPTKMMKAAKLTLMVRSKMIDGRKPS